MDLIEAEVPEVDHRIGEGLERVVQLTDAIKANEQALEFVFPSKHPLDGAEPFFKDGRIE